MLSFNFIQKILLFILLASITSCYTPHYLYVPAAVNTPAFTTKNESAINFLLSGNGADVQAAYSFSNHFAILGNVYWRNKKQHGSYIDSIGIFPNNRSEKGSVKYKRRLIEIDGAYFSHLDKRGKMYFEMVSGYGVGKFTMNELSNIYYYPTDSLEKSYAYNYNANIQHIFIQPSVFFNFNSLKVIYSIRFSGIIYHINAASYPPQTLDAIGFDVNNKLLDFMEQSLTYKISPAKINWLTINMQLGFSGSLQGSLHFYHRHFIGNIGAGIDPLKLLQKKPAAGAAF